MFNLVHGFNLSNTHVEKFRRLISPAFGAPSNRGYVLNSSSHTMSPTIIFFSGEKQKFNTKFYLGDIECLKQ